MKSNRSFENRHNGHKMSQTTSWSELWCFKLFGCRRCRCYRDRRWQLHKKNEERSSRGNFECLCQYKSFYGDQVTSYWLKPHATLVLALWTFHKTKFYNKNCLIKYFSHLKVVLKINVISNVDNLYSNHLFYHSYVFYCKGIHTFSN